LAASGAFNSIFGNDLYVANTDAIVEISAGF
jgi:hypothetical protein